MQNLKDRKPLLIKILAVILMAVLCCNLPGEILFWKLCTEQDRNIPPNTEVIVSACKRPIAIGVPDGETVFVLEERSGRIYLLDLRTGEKRKVPNDPLLVDKGVFLSSNLVWLRGYTAPPGSTGSSTIPHYILDLTDGQRYELFDITYLPRLEGGKFDPKNNHYFQSAEQVFIHHSESKIIALSSDFRTNPSGRVIFLHDSEALEQLMRDLEVCYVIVDIPQYFRFYSDIPSPSRRYVVRADGIYLLATNVAIANSEYIGRENIVGYFKNWYYDESGVVVQESADYLINTILGGRFIPIPRPILKLRLPASP